jgi:hypothetical protein
MVYGSIEKVYSYSVKSQPSPCNASEMHARLSLNYSQHFVLAQKTDFLTFLELRDISQWATGKSSAKHGLRSLDHPPISNTAFELQSRVEVDAWQKHVPFAL